jgi:16S rRNA (guanine966-N2)-methyltransferase
MRIISGLARGTRLEAPPGQGVRPTADRVRESLFSMLGDLTGWCVVDLFAGAGCLGLEALSRGAERVVFVENDRRHARVLQRNLAAVLRAMGSLGEGEAQAQVLVADVRQAPSRLRELAGRVDLVLADPPYRSAAGWGAAELLGDPHLAAWAETALLVLEHESEAALPWAPDSPWSPLRVRRYGSTTLSLARVAEPEP